MTVAEAGGPVEQPMVPPARGRWSQAVHDAAHTVVATLQGLVAASGALLVAAVALLLGLLGWRVGRRSWRRRQLS